MSGQNPYNHRTRLNLFFESGNRFPAGRPRQRAIMEIPPSAGASGSERANLQRTAARRGKSLLRIRSFFHRCVFATPKPRKRREHARRARKTALHRATARIRQPVRAEKSDGAHIHDIPEAAPLDRACAQCHKEPKGECQHLTLDILASTAQGRGRQGAANLSPGLARKV